MIRMLNLIEGIDPSIKEITIKFAIPVKLPTANELNDDKYKPDLLRQTFSGDSKLCTMEVITTQCIFQFLKAHLTNKILPIICLLKIILPSPKREMNLY
uniref:Uncharacterized protein n=1 Tax=Rhizophagus irregularis (strain DAOM 181602 / DAOM 197198 / MUCL 43194) TaxID=747089 RepID=U9SKI4_RHIID